ncbi:MULTISPECIES: ABC transporter ATP-binding protein [unclassified Mesorhizobium]|uniref:ABC transporter ATP-binding protein n=1 Tax=unclassified Mesorhizobium TaxID=325217 RepID=UPI000F75B313|nr:MULTISPECIES: ABC transporter ATP-binding protein [unclassified Mesorhizobium]AZO22799.1 ABC transporter ATP-binding protein [Mesorhizobium sp. M1E.F.Ca.ET.045.02.1.1]RUW30719.1 ATP-binding cassette domain-containing protein [Mesorhizobium sp. M1E.F.Ca.ET.041.01.1.1]RUW80544.1 ATP-binding cassette domain-containing protein [Mesorhizobium sp. M1E.F.Ca.ET.063.01.1.1]RWD87969.1 MAG: ATP-binding cassette domain-containing protein [Mesorhizobium sp.]RWD94104.1 MAG: ATP-binding cassette domain-co
MTAARLEVSGLSAGYGQTRVLEDVSFEAEAGARLAVLGRNGVGKSTLLATIAGQTRRHAGAIKLGDIDITGMDGASRAWQGLGYVPQERCIFPSLTVEENLFVGLKDRERSAVDEAYAMFPRLKERRRNYGNQLSGGEQQMLTTARTILGRPSILMLDEPLEGLAPVICDELMAALTRLASGGDMTILLVEQRIRAALDFADHVLILERGRIAWSGTPAALRASPQTVEGLLGVAAIPHSVA